MLYTAAKHCKAGLHVGRDQQASPPELLRMGLASVDVV
jgi:hypothetical protein